MHDTLDNMTTLHYQLPIHTSVFIAKPLSGNLLVHSGMLPKHWTTMTISKKNSSGLTKPVTMSTGCLSNMHCRSYHQRMTPDEHTNSYMTGSPLEEPSMLQALQLVRYACIASAKPKQYGTSWSVPMQKGTPSTRNCRPNSTRYKQETMLTHTYSSYYGKGFNPSEPIPLLMINTTRIQVFTNHFFMPRPK